MSIIIYYLFLVAVSDFEMSSLIISTVGARDEFSVIIVSGEPSFKIVFLGSSIIQSTRNNADNLGRNLRWEIQIFSLLCKEDSRIDRILQRSSTFLHELPKIFPIEKMFNKKYSIFKIIREKCTRIVRLFRIDGLWRHPKFLYRGHQLPFWSKMRDQQAW